MTDVGAASKVDTKAWRIGGGGEYGPQRGMRLSVYFVFSKVNVISSHPDRNSHDRPNTVR